MADKKNSTLLIEDASASLWRVDPDGRMVEIDSETLAKGPAAVAALAPEMEVSYFDKHPEFIPFEAQAFVKCSECGGKGFIECDVLFERCEGDRDGEPATWGAVAKYDEDEHEPLRRGQSVGPSVWDCDECGEGGMKLEATGAVLTLADLPRAQAMVAA